MRNFFYSKIALNNLKKNRRLYTPYVLMNIGVVMMFYIMHALAINEGLKSFPGADATIMLMRFGAVIVGIFALILMFYTNIFLIKQRKKEIGLFNVLGMEKKHIARMMGIETVMVGIVCILSGLVAGSVMSKLMYMVLIKSMGFSVTVDFDFSPASFIVTSVFFGILFLGTLLFNVAQIHLLNPIKLLKGSNMGEKEPQIKWLMTVTGFVTMAAGYGMALKISTPLEAIGMFFFAVILVIVGTYTLFTSGSIALLKALKKNKAFYYHPKHFTALSGLIYRMKQNAMGLASICVLSTAVLVTVSTTVSMYMGMEDMLDNRFPQMISLSIPNVQNQDIDLLEKKLDQLLEKHDVDVTNATGFKSQNALMNLNENELLKTYSFPSDYFVTIIPLDDFNRLQGTDYQLQTDEILIHGNTDLPIDKQIQIEGADFKVKEVLDAFVLTDWPEVNLTDSLFIITSTHVIDEAQQYYHGFDIEGTDEAVMAFNQEIYRGIQLGDQTIRVQSKDLLRDDFLSVYGGFLFLGVFLGTLFLMATVMIIYYKQMSEGYDDKKRFDILQKVGMAEDEIKTSINSQILMIFFLPLITAIIHIAFAFNAMVLLLTLFGFSNVHLFIKCTVATILAFAVIYTLVYKNTTKAYYRIVREKTTY